MANVDERGHLGEGYEIGPTETLNGIACRYIDEAWVVGAHGTVLYTSDAGDSWESQDLGTTADLHALATQDAGRVFIAGDGVFLTAEPDFQTGAATWQNLGDGVTKFRSLAAAQQGETVLAVSEDGGIWSYTGGLVKTTTLTGMRAVAVSPSGLQAIVVGDGVYRSVDAGATWTQVPTDGSFDAVRIEDTGDAVLVGKAGLVARIDSENRVLTQHIGTADLLSLHIAPRQTAYSGTGYAAGVGGQVWMTKDGGWTWTMGPLVGGTVLSVDEIGDGHN
ncbi:MAG TPA: hypothetical protein VFQ53_29895 [Kofleriaceae bacterium]|nr:hypothetical protein [Kofleriaceae bacterium]